MLLWSDPNYYVQYIKWPIKLNQCHKAGHFEKPGTGIAFVLPVDQVASLESQESQESQIERFKEEARKSGGQLQKQGSAHKEYTRRSTHCFLAILPGVFNICDKEVRAEKSYPNTSTPQ